MNFSLNNMDMAQESGKIKILVLDKDDNRLEGHAYSTYQSLPECYDKRMVAMNTMHNDMSIALLNCKSLSTKLFLFIWRKWHKLYCLVKYGIIKKNKKEHYLRLFFGSEYTPFSAKRILAKHSNFKPDIITIHWTSQFLTSKIIRDLHKKTKALIAFVGVDEAHMTAGCHYPVDCEGYKTGCSDCPIFVRGKRLPSDMMRRKIKNFRDVPFVVLGGQNFCKKAADSSVLKLALSSFSYVRIPQVTIYKRLDARKSFGISEDSYVVLFAAAILEETRKGLVYALEALREISDKIPNLVLLLPGKITHMYDIPNVKIVSPGYLDKEDLFKAFCASDCFLSTTIADAGPMMVNYSVALGIPVVSFSVGVAQDLIVHKNNGYIARFKDSKDIANGIFYLSQLSEEEKEKMKLHCFEITEKWKCKKTIYEQLADFYYKAYSNNK